MSHEEETLESLAEAVEGLMAVVQANAFVLLRVVRTLERMGIIIDEGDPPAPTSH